MKANKILTTASDTINNRASERDQEQERSMSACVNAFNALYGTELTETMGWQFMVLLKMSRAKGGDFKLDDYIDGAAYFALAGESAATPVVIGVDESVVSPPLPEKGWTGNQWKPVNPVAESFIDGILDHDSNSGSVVNVDTLRNAYHNWGKCSDPLSSILDALRRTRGWVIELDLDGETEVIKGASWKHPVIPDFTDFERYFDDKLKYVDQGSLSCLSIDESFTRWCIPNGYIANGRTVEIFLGWLINQNGVSRSDDNAEERIIGVVWK